MRYRTKFMGCVFTGPEFWDILVSTLFRKIATHVVFFRDILYGETLGVPRACKGWHSTSFLTITSQWCCHNHNYMNDHQIIMNLFFPLSLSLSKYIHKYFFNMYNTYTKHTYWKTYLCLCIQRGKDARDSHPSNPSNSWGAKVRPWNVGSCLLAFFWFLYIIYPPIPSRESSHIPPGGSRKTIDSKVPGTVQ